MLSVIYILGTLLGLLCAIMLLRAYKNVGSRLLLWSGLCFVGLSISNLFVFIDLVLVPEVNLYSVRLWTAALATMLLVYGLIWESE